MNIVEAFNILLENPNPVIVRHNKQGKKTITERNNTQLPIYSGSKGGRYWFDCGLVSETEIVALFALAVIIEQQPVKIHIPLVINLTEEDETQHGFLCTSIDFDKDGEITLPLMDLGVAKQIYENRSNGYCNFKTYIMTNGKIHVELGSELCLDELLAIYSLMQEEKKHHENKSNQHNS